MHVNFRILVVDDNAVNRKVLTAMLQEAGYAVDVASGGPQALTQHEAHAYDLVLMDIHMPVMDGYETARRIRQSRRSQPVIVAITVRIIDENREKCFENGMNGYLPKPFTRSQLMEVVAAAHNERSCAENTDRTHLIGSP